ncbi:MAG TPA: hypothetical protein VGO92_04015 [Acidimicrobiales bacterium]|nr:hypothetical protein [Acidimicrobiales bacterium]
MKFRKIAGVSAILLGAASILTFAPSAEAATTGNNTLTFALSGTASLAIAVPANPSSVSGSVTTGSVVPVTLGNSTVTDNTGSLLGWTVTADATDLSDGSGHTITKTNVVWLTGTVAATATGLLTGVSVGAGGAFGATPVTVARALANFGGGAYNYPATVTLTVPVNTFAATYTTVVTQTVA